VEPPLSGRCSILLTFEKLTTGRPRRTRPCGGVDRPAHDSGARPGAWAGSPDSAMGGPRPRLTLALAIRSGANAQFLWISSDRPARPRADERDHKRDIRKVRGGTRFDPCQQHHCFALWTWRPVKRDHDAVPLHQARARYSQSPVGAVMGTVMGNSFPRSSLDVWSKRTIFRNS
jgi:hypothetical protein